MSKQLGKLVDLVTEVTSLYNIMIVGAMHISTVKYNLYTIQCYLLCWKIFSPVVKYRILLIFINITMGLKFDLVFSDTNKKYFH